MAAKKIAQSKLLGSGFLNFVESGLDDTVGSLLRPIQDKNPAKRVRKAFDDIFSIPGNIAGNFPSNRRKRKEAKKEAGRQVQIKNLFQSILKMDKSILDEQGNVREGAIDARSQQEALDLLFSSNNSKLQLTNTRRFLSQAREGTDPKFKSRIGTQLAYETLVDRSSAERIQGRGIDFGSILRK